MIDQSHQLLILLVVVLTVLGFVVGYCVASIRVRDAARKTIESLKARKMVEAGNESKPDVEAAPSEVVIAANQSAQDGTPNTPSGSISSQAHAEITERERLLHTHMQLQTKRIKRLEAQIAEFGRLHSKSQDNVEVHVVEPETREPASLSRKLNLEDLPILSRRVGNAASGVPETPAPQESFRREPLRPLSKELEIPVLAESELPDTSEEWQADGTTGGISNDRAGRRG